MAKHINAIKSDRAARPPRGRARFTERELARAARAARSAGAIGVEVDPASGKIRVLLGKPSELAQDIPAKIINQL
jgi:hypothetical protein